MYAHPAMATRKDFPAALVAAAQALEAASGERSTDLRLANLLGVTPSTILRWRLGKNAPPAVTADAMLARLADETRKAARKRPPAT